MKDESNGMYGFLLHPSSLILSSIGFSGCLNLAYVARYYGRSIQPE